MLIVDRQQRLLEILRQKKTAQLDDLARELDVSSSTVRRDLETMEQGGVVARTHGGAIYKGGIEGHTEPPLEGASYALAARMQENVEQKRAIGALAAQMVQPQMTILLDGGSTVICAAQLIIARPLQVVTNSLAIANHFADDDQVEILLIGGNLYPRTSVLVGPLATGCLADLHADLVLFSTAAIYGDEAFNINLAMAQVEQVMMRQAAQSVILMDSSKFGRKSLVRVCGLQELDWIVTDNLIDPSWPNQLGDRLLIADPSNSTPSNPTAASAPQ